jgi:hypothetical protein
VGVVPAPLPGLLTNASNPVTPSWQLKQASDTPVGLPTVAVRVAEAYWVNAVPRGLVLFHNGAAVFPACGVWQNTQISCTLVDLMVLEVAELRLCFVSAIPAALAIWAAIMIETIAIVTISIVLVIDLFISSPFDKLDFNSLPASIMTCHFCLSPNRLFFFLISIPFYPETAHTMPVFAVSTPLPIYCNKVTPR